MTLDDEGAGALISSPDPTGIVGQANFIHRRVIGGIGGFLKGGPAGAVGGFLSPPRAQRPSPGTGVMPMPGGQLVVPTPGPRAAAQRFFPGGKTGLEVAGMEGMKIACPSGYHANRSDYFLKSGEYVAEGSRCVKNRRRNPMNPRALSRAIGRVDAGKALQGKLTEITTAKWTAGGKRKHP